MHCDNCKSALKEGTKYCRNCGRQNSSNFFLKEIEPPSNPITGECCAEENLISSNKKPQQKRNLVISIILIFVIGGFGYSLIRDNTQQEEDIVSNVVILEENNNQVEPEIKKTTTINDVIVIPEISFIAQNQANEHPQGEQLLTEDEFLLREDEYINSMLLESISKEKIGLIRNEIYARHGYNFISTKFEEYFTKKSWYKVNENFSESSFSKIERRNLLVIMNFEMKKGWR